MHPAGHLASSIVFSGGVYAATRSIPLAVGSFVGGFLIDLDHYFDYVVFHRRFHPDPRRFLDFYLKHRFKYIVLPLHSYELFALQGAFAYLWACPWMTGYLLGVALHMSFDLTFNGNVIRRIVPFYSFLYRWKMGFLKERMFRPELLASPPEPAPEPAGRN